MFKTNKNVHPDFFSTQNNRDETKINESENMLEEIRRFYQNNKTTILIIGAGLLILYLMRK